MAGGTKAVSENHITPEQISQYNQGDMSRETRNVVKLHISNCTQCQDRLRAFAASPSIVQADKMLTSAMKVGDHLEYEQAAAYLGGGCSPRERTRVEDHLQRCASCASLVSDFRLIDGTSVTTDDKPWAAPEASRQPAVSKRPRISIRAVAWVALASAVILVAVFKAARTRQNLLIAKNVPDRQVVSPDTGDQEYKALFAQSLRDANPALELPVARLSQLKTERVVLGAGDQSASRIKAVQPSATFEFSGQPTFKWIDKSNASQHTLQITTANLQAIATVTMTRHDSTMHVVVRDRSGKAIAASYDTPYISEWTAPESVTLFKPGARYSWTVEISGGSEATADSSRSAIATFETVNTKQFPALEKARFDYADRPKLLGIVYASQGLLAEADQEFRKAISANARDAQAKRLLNLLEKEASSIKPAGIKPGNYRSK
jgi:anti-sigma factor RsiW